MDSYELSVEVNAPVSTCYRYWRDFKSFPDFMDHVLEVIHLRRNIWCWYLQGDHGDECRWELILDRDIPNELISWRTLSGPELDMTVDVDFQPINQDKTRIHVSIVTFTPDIGLGKVLQDLFSVSRQQVRQDLDGFKHRVETHQLNGHEPELPEIGLPSRTRQKRKPEKSFRP